MRPIQMVDLKKQYHQIKEEIDSAVLGVLESSVFIGGKPVQDFAQHLSDLQVRALSFPVPMAQMRCKLP